MAGARQRVTPRARQLLMMATDVSRVTPVPARAALRLVSVFFFQAEDGIRDVAVTGVQTCALPIYLQDGIPWQQILSVDEALPQLAVEDVPESELEARVAAAAATGIRLEEEIPLKVDRKSVV